MSLGKIYLEKPITLDLEAVRNILIPWISGQLGCSNEQLSEVLVALEDNSIRNLIFPLFETDQWIEIRREILKSLESKFQIQIDEVAFQRTGSIRVYRPDALGTSFHADSWYGHGTQTYTTWIPIVEPLPGGSIHFVDSGSEDFTRYITNSLMNEKMDLGGANDYLAKRSKEMLCQLSQGLLFHSSMIHGSLKNTSGRTRISIDVRFSLNPNNLGSKLQEDFEIIKPAASEGKTLNSSSNKFPKPRCLKYINGEFGHSTRTQHILINAYAKERNLDIVAQEAEIEGYGTPVLKYYLRNIRKTSIDKVLLFDRAMLAGLCKEELLSLENNMIVISES